MALGPLLWAGTGPDGCFCFKRHHAAVPGVSRNCRQNLIDTCFSRSVRDLQSTRSSSSGQIGAAGTSAIPETYHYLTSTLAPASSSFFFALSESALLAPSRTGFGAPSTSALASAKPRPALISRTALITAIFWSAGTEARITSNAVFTSAAGAVAAPPAGATAAAATGAAALTPHLVSSCL